MCIIRFWISLLLNTSMTRIRFPDRVMNSMCSSELCLTRGSMTTAASLVISDNRLDVRTTRCWTSTSAAISRAMRSIILSSICSTLSRLSTNRRNPRAVGTRPADVWGDRNNPMSSRSAITLRMVAGLRARSVSRDKVREPTGWPSWMKCSTSDLNKNRLRSFKSLTDSGRFFGIVQCNVAKFLNGKSNAQFMPAQKHAALPVRS